MIKVIRLDSENELAKILARLSFNPEPPPAITKEQILQGLGEVQEIKVKRQKPEPKQYGPKRRRRFPIP